MLFIGIDIGTTNCKIGVYEKDGERVRSAEFGTPVENLPQGAAWYDMEKMWRMLVDTLKNLLGSRAMEVRGIGVSSQGESCLLTDREFRPLTKAIPWYDTRTMASVDIWKKRMEEDELYTITGLKLQSIYTIMKLEWFRDNLGEAYKNTYKFHCMSDYIAGRMAGVHCMTYAMASRTMALDLNQKQWCDEIIRLSGIKKEIFPDLTEADRPLGFVWEKFSKETGVPGDCMVSIAGFDHLVGCLGVGAIKEEVVVASIGTTESVCLVSDRPLHGREYYGYLWGCHVFSQKYYAIGGMPAGGQTIDWVIQNLLRREISAESYGELERLCALAPQLSNGVLFLPHLCGCCAPVMDNRSMGAFWGLGKNTDLKDMLRAVVEGLCYEFRLVLEQSGRQDIKEIAAIGGGSKNAFWMQCKADVLGIPVKVVSIPDAVTLGGAMVAATGAGEVIETTGQNRSVRYEPDACAHLRYSRVYETIYRNLYLSQKNVTEKMQKILQEI